MAKSQAKVKDALDEKTAESLKKTFGKEAVQVVMVTAPPAKEGRKTQSSDSSGDKKPEPEHTAPPSEDKEKNMEQAQQVNVPPEILAALTAQLQNQKNEVREDDDEFIVKLAAAIASANKAEQKGKGKDKEEQNELIRSLTKASHNNLKVDAYVDATPISRHFAKAAIYGGVALVVVGGTIFMLTLAANAATSRMAAVEE